MKPFFSNGRRISTKETAPVRNPWSGEVIDSVCVASESEVTAALDAASAAFEVTRKHSAAHRSDVLTRVAAGIAARRAEFVETIVAEAGKPVVFAEAEVDRACLTFRFAAAEALRDEGSGLAIDASTPGAGHVGFARRFPIGVILGVTPFNFPLNLVAHKVAPCLAVGCTMLLKPALKTPLSALLLAEVLEAAGVTPGQIETVPFGHELIDGLLADPRVKMLSFTGSVDVGWSLKARAVRQKVALELGGNAAVVVEPDADWKAAVPKIATGAFGSAGQSCISVQRILVHESLLPEFRKALVDFILTKVKVGDPSARETVVGPMINAAARTKVVDWISKAVAAGARLLTPCETSGESVLSPVLLEDCPPGCEVVCEEVFAPVAVLQPYRTFEEALRLVNASRFGIHAGLFTSDLAKALTAYEEIEAGGVLVNQVPTFRVENLPYGGLKESGAGREGVRYAMEEMTEIRSLVINRG